MILEANRVYSAVVEALDSQYDICPATALPGADIWEDLQLEYEDVLLLNCDVLASLDIDPGVVTLIDLDAVGSVQSLVTAIINALA